MKNRILRCISVLAILTVLLSLCSCDLFDRNEDVNVAGNYTVKMDGADAQVVIGEDDCSLQYETRKEIILPEDIGIDTSDTYIVESYCYVGTYVYDKTEEVLTFSVANTYQKLTFEGPNAEVIKEYYIEKCQSELEAGVDTEYNTAMLKMLRDGEEADVTGITGTDVPAEVTIRLAVPSVTGEDQDEQSAEVPEAAVVSMMYQDSDGQEWHSVLDAEGFVVETVIGELETKKAEPSGTVGETAAEPGTTGSVTSVPGTTAPTTSPSDTGSSAASSSGTAAGEESSSPAQTAAETTAATGGAREITVYNDFGKAVRRDVIYYDDTGFEYKIMSYYLDGTIMSEKNYWRPGVLKSSVSYDSHGILTDRKSFYESGAPEVETWFSQDGYLIYHYDESGKELKIEEYKNGQLTSVNEWMDSESYYYIREYTNGELTRIRKRLENNKQIYTKYKREDGTMQELFYNPTGTSLGLYKVVEYDNTGAVISTMYYDENENMYFVLETENGEECHRYADYDYYYKDGKPVREVRYRTPLGMDSPERKVFDVWTEKTYSYNESGMRTGYVFLEYDLGVLINRITYDELTRTEIETPYFNGKPEEKTEKQYDENGYLIHRIWYLTNGKKRAEEFLTENEREGHTLFYDESGNVIIEQYGVKYDNQTTKFIRETRQGLLVSELAIGENGFGELFSMEFYAAIGGDIGSFSFEYYSGSKVKTRTAYNVIGGLMSVEEYDEAGRITKTTYYEAGSVSQSVEFEYGAGDVVTKESFYNGKHVLVATVSYDVSGKFVSVVTTSAYRAPSGEH